MSKYRKLTNSTRKNRPAEVTDFAGDPGSSPGQALDAIAREGTRRMLLWAVDTEVNEFLGRQRYERTELSVGYRNGYGKQRQVTRGSGTVSIRAPRVRDSGENNPQGCFNLRGHRYFVSAASAVLIAGS